MGTKGTAFDATPARMTTLGKRRRRRRRQRATYIRPGSVAARHGLSWCCRNSKLNGLNYFSSNLASVQFVAHSLSQFHYYKYYYYYYYCHSKFTVYWDSDSERERGERAAAIILSDWRLQCAFICNWNCVTLFFDFAIHVVCARFCIGIAIRKKHWHCQFKGTHTHTHARACANDTQTH